MFLTSEMVKFTNYPIFIQSLHDISLCVNSKFPMEFLILLKFVLSISSFIQILCFSY